MSLPESRSRPSSQYSNYSRPFENISNTETIFSMANRTSFYNKQKRIFERNLEQYEQVKQCNVHQHVRDLANVFTSLSQPILPVDRHKNKNRTTYDARLRS